MTNSFDSWIDKKQSQSPYLKLEELEQVRITPLKAEAIPNKFDKTGETETIEYTVLLGENQKTFTSQNFSFAQQFQKCLKMKEKGEATQFLLEKSPIKTQYGMKFSYSIIKAFKDSEAESVGEVIEKKVVPVGEPEEELSKEELEAIDIEKIPF